MLHLVEFRHISYDRAALLKNQSRHQPHPKREPNATKSQEADRMQAVKPARREHSILIQPTVAHAGGDVCGGFGKGQDGLDRGRLGEQFNGGEIGARKRQRVE